MSIVMLLRSLLHIVIATASVVTPTTRLVNDILSRPYESDVRPAIDRRDVTKVTIIPNKFILLAMDQQQETIKFTEEFLLSWIDPMLSWNTSIVDYSNEWVKIPESKVWTPDVIFDSSISITELLDPASRMIDLKHDGTLRQSNPAVIEFPCRLRIADFPYDVQVCNVTIGPWNFDNKQVVVLKHEDIISPIPEQFEGNSEWELVQIEAYEGSSLDQQQGLYYSFVNYRVTLKRKPVYYVLVIQAPTFIMSTLTIFGLFSPFNQAYERREKVTLGLNMFVSISMMLNLVSTMMPKASKLPLLGNYILAEIFVCGIGVLVSIAILTMHQKCHTRVLKVPSWVHRFILFECSSKVDPMTSSSSVSSANIQMSSTSSPDVVPLFALHNTIQKASLALQKSLSFHEKAHRVRLLWIVVFDRIDLFCLILFQMFNIIASALFMR